MGNLMANGSPPSGEWIRSIVTQYEGPLLRYAARLTGDGHRARDCVQETFLRLCRQHDTSASTGDATLPPENGRLAAWLFAVCRNQALDVLRKERPMRVLSDEFSVLCESREATPGDDAEQAETNEQLLKLLDELPAAQQEVVRLKFQHGLSYRQISEVTGRSTSYVGLLIHQALVALRRRVPDDISN